MREKLTENCRCPPKLFRMGNINGVMLIRFLFHKDEKDLKDVGFAKYSRRLSNIHAVFQIFTLSFKYSRCLSNIHAVFQIFTPSFNYSRRLSIIHAIFQLFTPSFNGFAGAGPVPVRDPNGNLL